MESAVRVFLADMEDVDNTTTVLVHNDRICEIDMTILLSMAFSRFEKLITAMQRPFPALTHLELVSDYGPALISPGSFLGGSAPLLQILHFRGIPFPGLPKLLLSTTQLVLLQLQNIPRIGYFSPEEMATCLSALTRLECLEIGFKSLISPLDWTSPPPQQTRTLLPSLTKMHFKGASEYLEDFVARINVPLLKELNTTFFHERIFDTPKFTQFISRTPKFKAHHEAHMFFSEWMVSLELPLPTLTLGILCREPDTQLSSLTQVCSSCLPQALVSVVERLYIQNTSMLPRWHDDIENSRWLELLHPFIAVKSLYISRDFVPRIALAFQELVGERVTEVLPALQTLFLQGTIPLGHVQQTVEQFVAARQLAGHPIAISRWEL